MSSPDNKFNVAIRAYASYLIELHKVNEVFKTMGITTKNVDPIANFAELLVANHCNGVIQKAANKGFDVVGEDGTRIQVKSLRVSSDRPGDNCINWFQATRHGGKPDSELIDADWLAIVVFVDWRPYALLTTPVVKQDRFPVICVRDIYLTHVEKVLATDTESTDELKVVRLPWECVRKDENPTIDG